jgi:hypothetical protein
METSPEKSTPSLDFGLSPIIDGLNGYSRTDREYTGEEK